MVSGCPACWLATRETHERLAEHANLLAETNVALKEAGLNLNNTVRARHMTEVLIEDIGWAAMKAPVVKPLDHLKIAGYVGWPSPSPTSRKSRSATSSRPPTTAAPT